MPVSNRRHTHARSLVLLTVIAAVACESYDFGDKAKQFVDTEAYSYSKRLVASDLAVRWENFFHVALVEVGLALDEVSRELPDLPAADALWSTRDSEGAAVQQLVFYDRSLPVVRRGALRMRDTRATLERIRAACGDDRIFSEMNLEGLAVLAPLGSLEIPQRDLTIYIGTSSSGSNDNSPDVGFWGSLVDSLRSIFNDSEWQRQKQKLEEAIRDYPQRVVQRPELFEMSRSTCDGILARYDTALAGATQSADGYLQLLAGMERALDDMRRHGEAVLAPRFVGATGRRTGVLADFERWRRDELAAAVVRELAVGINEMNGLVRHAESEASGTVAAGCMQAMAAFEEAADAVLELQATAAAVQDVLLDGRRADWVKRRAGEVESVRRRLETAVAPRIRSRCAS